MFVNIIGVTVPVCVMLNNLRMVFLFAGVLPGMIWSLFIDAMPSGLRRFASILGTIAGIMCMLFLQVALYYNWMELKHVSYSVGDIDYAASGVASRSI